MLDEAKIREAVDALLEAAPEGSKVILFGSYAAGRARPDSDLDFLVIEPEVQDRMEEMVRLSRLLGKLLIPADVAVVGRDEFHRFRDTPNTLHHRAFKQGKVYEPLP